MPKWLAGMAARQMEAETMGVPTHPAADLDEQQAERANPSVARGCPVRD
jgi:hypothetical protein